MLFLPFTMHPRGYSICLPHLPSRSCVKITRIGATSSDTEHNQPPSMEKKSKLAVVLDLPLTIWRQTLRPLNDFGFGHRSIWEGGVGLFLVTGAVILALSLVWLRGFQLRSKFRKYSAVFEFSQACGISTGTPVRIRGVTVGNVIRVNPSLKSIEAAVEVCFMQYFILLIYLLFSFNKCKSYIVTFFDFKLKTLQ